MCNLPEGADIQCRLFDEVIKALPDSSSPVTVEIVNGMLFLDAVLQEVLRLYPPIGMVFRPAQKSFNISGIQVPKGTRMVLSIYLLHRNPKVWGKRAEEFIPIDGLGLSKLKLPELILPQRIHLHSYPSMLELNSASGRDLQ